MMTFDSATRTHDTKGNAMGVALGTTRTHDGRTVDSTGAFLVGELERLDQTLNMPLVNIQYTRDVDFREDVTFGDDISSYTLSSFGSNGGLGTGNGIGNGKAWSGKNATQIASVSVDIEKITNPLNLWALEISWSIPELQSAIQAGRPIDQQKFDVMNLKAEMDTEEQVYIGDGPLGITGLINNSKVSTVENVVAGAGGSTKWSQKTPDEILADFNTALTTVWEASAFAVKPERILIPPAQFGYIATAKVATQAGLVSIKRYIEENNLLTANGGGKLTILDSKWCIGAGVGGTLGQVGTTDRMAVYTKNKQFVRFTQTAMQRTPVEYRSIYHLTTYFKKLGVIETVYPETMGYFDGI